MKDTENILFELQELSPSLSGITNKNVFTVPEGYFNNISAHILLLAIASDNTFLKAGSSTNVPENYFENLASSILNKIKAETISEVFHETNSISTLVAGIGNKNVFTIEPHYFENTITQIQAITQPAAKIITLKNRFPIFKYAAAAIITGIIGLSAFLIFKNNTAIKPSAEMAAVITEANQIIKANSFDKELNSISDDSIVQFLESKGQNVEAALVASLVDDKALPNVEEYLLDDNTLDNVLKTLDLNN